MHARVSFYEGDAGVDFDSGVQAFQTAVSSVGEMDGNQGATLLIDRNSGKAITITYRRAVAGLRGGSNPKSVNRPGMRVGFRSGPSSTTRLPWTKGANPPSPC